MTISHIKGALELDDFIDSLDNVAGRDAKHLK